MKNSLFLLLLIGLASSVFAQDANNVKVFADKKASSISYSMHHPLHSWTGVSNDVTSLILTDADRSTVKQVAVNVKIASFDSQNANRDSHVIEASEGLKYPTVSFSSSSIQTQGDLLLVKGTLAFHGVSQPVSFQATRKKVGSKLEISGEFTLKMTQFKIEPPSLMGMSTDDDFKLTFKMLY
ncbi:MAG: YceI family protein [Sphingobacteriaceae bacterium]